MMFNKSRVVRCVTVQLGCITISVFNQAFVLWFMKYVG